jgi:putative flippase GtrA
MDTVHSHRPTFVTSFTRAQIAAGIGTAADFGLLFLLTEIFGVWYVASTAIGALAGAVTNFFLNRHWSFNAAHRKAHHQAIRYSIVSGISLLLNAGGVWALTESTHLHYGYSVFLVSITVGVFFNFPLHRYFVYR